MRYFPMFHDTRGRTALIAGGGEQATQKARLIARSEADIRLMALDVGAELTTLIASGRATHVQAICDLSEVKSADIIFAATGCVGLDGIIAAEAARVGAIANVVDRPALSTAITPAIVDRAPLVVAVGTEGAAPVLAQHVRMQAESWLEPEIGGFAAAIEAYRPQVADAAGSARAFWAWVFGGTPWALWREGDQTGALALIETTLAKGDALPPKAGLITFATLPDEADLTPLRVLRRLQDADILVQGPDVPAEIMEFTRRDAKRVADAHATFLTDAIHIGANVVVLNSPLERSLAAELNAIGEDVEII